MENNKNKKSVKFQGDMLNFYDFIQVFVFTRNHHLNLNFNCDVKSGLRMNYKQVRTTSARDINSQILSCKF